MDDICNSDGNIGASKDGIQNTNINEKEADNECISEFDASMIRQKFISNCATILSKEFPYGLRRGSVIDRKKFCRKYEELTGNSLSKEDINNLWETCISFGIVIEDRVFPFRNEAAELVKSKLDSILSSGAQQGYYASVFEKYRQEFCDCGIYSAEILAGAIRKLYPKFKHSNKFFRVTKGASIEDDIVRILKDTEALTLEEIQIRLPNIPKERIIQVCGSSDRIIKDHDICILLENLQFDKSEIDQITTKIREEVRTQGYALLKEIKLKNSIALNCDVSTEILQHGVFQKYLSSEYDISRKIISAKGISLSVTKILTEFCKKHTTFSLAEIKDLALNLNGYEGNQGLAVAQCTALQIDSNHFVRSDQIDFDINCIDSALSKIVVKSLPLSRISSFFLFPSLQNYPWTPQLLASYCRLISRQFTLLETAASNACTGLIARKNIFDSYYHAVAYCALTDGIKPDYKAIENYSLHMKLLSKKRGSALKSILSEMIKLKGEFR